MVSSINFIIIQLCWFQESSLSDLSAPAAARSLPFDVAALFVHQRQRSAGQQQQHCLSLTPGGEKHAVPFTPLRAQSRLQFPLLRWGVSSPGMRQPAVTSLMLLQQLKHEPCRPGFPLSCHYLRLSRCWLFTIRVHVCWENTSKTCFHSGLSNRRAERPSNHKTCKILSSGMVVNSVKWHLFCLIYPVQTNIKWKFEWVIDK